MIQDILPEIFDRTYQHSINPIAIDYIILVIDGKIVLKNKNSSYSIPKIVDLEKFEINNIKFIGTLKGEKYFTGELNKGNFPNDNNDDNNFILEDIFFTRTMDKTMRWIIALAVQLNSWYKENKFCGRCSKEFQDKPDERALLCPNCRNVVYPKISPAVIVRITKGDQILLARAKNFRGTFYSLIAGFVDLGETLEEAVVREVKEEVGLTLDAKDVKYYKSQPWPYSSSMMIGYFVEYTGNEELTICEKELTDAEWFGKNNLPEIPSDISIAGEMINLFINE